MSGVIAALMQLAGIGVFVVGSIYLLDGAQHGSGTERLPLVIGAAVCALMLFAVAEIIHILDDTRTAAERGADALDRLAKARTGVASSLPPDAAKRIREMPQGKPQD